MSRRSDPKYSDNLSLPADPKLSSRSDASEILRTSDAGEGRLQQLGYQQEFVRGFSAFTNFGISFSIMSLMTGVTGEFCTHLFNAFCGHSFKPAIHLKYLKSL